MADDEDSTERGSTRRGYLAGSGALVAGGLLAGCTGDGDGGGDTTPTDAGTTTETTTGTGTTTDAESWTVSMAPVGDVTFDAVPEEVMVYNLLYADMAVAYGHGDAVNSLGFDAETGGTTLDAFYERLDGVGFDAEGLTQLNSGSGTINVDREEFLRLESDVHLVDPCLMTSFDGWDEDDVESVEEQVGPWFGNNYSRAHSQPPAGCRDRYEYYTLWEIAAKVAAVFRESERYEALAGVRDDLLSTIQDDLPPEDDRPTVGMMLFMDDTFYPSKINVSGFATAHVRPLGATDVFADEDVTYETTYDYEDLLTFDPDVILHSFGIASYYSVSDVRAQLEDHPVGSQLTAVQEGQVYPSGNPVQGPLMNLFQVEMTAKQLYPDRFGAWPEYEDGAPYPEIPAEEQLFDRERVAETVRGDG